MCISPEAYVEARVYERLRGVGVDEKKARAVGRKVRRAYSARRQEARARALLYPGSTKHDHAAARRGDDAA